MQNSYSHHNNENAFVFEAIQRMTEARYIKQPNGRPFISPQEFEIGMFILMSYMKQMTETMEIKTLMNFQRYLSNLFIRATTMKTPQNQTRLRCNVHSKD
jgi:hypothetical protein